MAKCFTVCLVTVLLCRSTGSPVFFPEEAVYGGGGGVGSVVQKEDADTDKLGEKALVDETILSKTAAAAVGEEQDSSTEPVKNLLIRTFTYLHPKIALELINKTMSIANETEATVQHPTTENIPLSTISDDDDSATIEPVSETTLAATTELPLFTSTAQTPTTHVPRNTVSGTAEEKELEEIEKEIEAEPVILTQVV